MFIDRPPKNAKLKLHATQYLVMIVLSTLHFGYVSGQMGIDEAYVGLVQFETDADTAFVTLKSHKQDISYL